MITKREVDQEPRDVIIHRVVSCEGETTASECSMFGSQQWRILVSLLLQVSKIGVLALAQSQLDLLIARDRSSHLWQSEDH